MKTTVSVPFPELASAPQYPEYSARPRPCPKASPEFKAILAEIQSLGGEFVQVRTSRSASRIQVELTRVGPGSHADKRRDRAAYDARLAASRAAYAAAKAKVSALLPGGGWSYDNQFDLFLPRADLATR